MHRGICKMGLLFYILDSVFVKSANDTWRNGNIIITPERRFNAMIIFDQCVATWLDEYTGCNHFRTSSIMRELVPSPMLPLTPMPYGTGKQSSIMHWAWVSQHPVSSLALCTLVTPMLYNKAIMTSDPLHQPVCHIRWKNTCIQIARKYAFANLAYITTIMQRDTCKSLYILLETELWLNFINGFQLALKLSQ